MVLTSGIMIFYLLTLRSGSRPVAIIGLSVIVALDMVALLRFGLLH